MSSLCTYSAALIRYFTTRKEDRCGRARGRQQKHNERQKKYERKKQVSRLILLSVFHTIELTR